MAPIHSNRPKKIETLNALPLTEYRSKLCPFLSIHPTFTTTTTTTTTSIQNTYLPTPLDTTSNDHPTAESLLQVAFDSSTTLPTSDLNACLNLIAQTSQYYYETSSFGWSAAKKRKEMRLPDLRYIILRSPTLPIAHETQDAQGTQPSKYEEGTRGEGNRREGPGGDVAGFLSFMLTYEDGKEVVYCYEIHLTDQLRGKGVGAQLMRMLEDVGARAGVEKTMLTVLNANGGARKFYERLGYVVDEYSPRARKLRGRKWKMADYTILSKRLGGGVVGEVEGGGERGRR